MLWTEIGMDTMIEYMKVCWKEYLMVSNWVFHLVFEMDILMDAKMEGAKG